VSVTERLHSRRALLRVGGAALAVAAAGCLGGRSSGPAVVSMAEGLRFDPETATVEAGGTVRWENDSDVAHTVTGEAAAIPGEGTYFASGGFDTERAARDSLRAGLVDPGESYEHTFETPGTYGYYCIPHEGSGMAGRVRVR
jgi:plastocyanin